MKPAANDIRRRRLLFGLTIEQASALAHVSKGMWSDVETGRRHGSPATRKRIAAVLECRPDDLDKPVSPEAEISIVKPPRTYRLAVKLRIEHGVSDEVCTVETTSDAAMIVSTKPLPGEFAVCLAVDAPLLGWRAGDTLRVQPATFAPSGSVVIARQTRDDGTTLDCLKLYVERHRARSLLPMNPSIYRAILMSLDPHWSIVGVVVERHETELLGRFEDLAEVSLTTTEPRN